MRAIGVSNFMRHHLADLFERTEIVPAVNQIELPRPEMFDRPIPED